MAAETKKERTRTVAFVPEEYATFDTQAPENRIKMFNAHNASASLNQIGDEHFKIVDVMAERGERTNSKNPCQNTYIFTDDGRVLFTQSNGIAKTINEIVVMVNSDFAGNTSNGYVEVHVAAMQLSGDKTYKRLQLDAI